MGFGPSGLPAHRKRVFFSVTAREGASEVGRSRSVPEKIFLSLACALDCLRAHSLLRQRPAHAAPPSSSRRRASLGSLVIRLCCARLACLRHARSPCAYLNQKSRGGVGYVYLVRHRFPMPAQFLGIPRGGGRRSPSVARASDLFGRRRGRRSRGAAFPGPSWGFRLSGVFGISAGGYVSGSFLVCPLALPVRRSGR